MSEPESKRRRTTGQSIPRSTVVVDDDVPDIVEVPASSDATAPAAARFDGSSLYMVQNPLIRSCPKWGYIPLRDVVQPGARFALVSAMCCNPEFVSTLIDLRSCQLIIVADGGDDLQARTTGKVEKLAENVTLVIPRMPIPKAGVMHAKMFVLEYPSFLRVAISSSNLDAPDYEMIGQCIWAIDFPRVSASKPCSQFITDLRYFVSRMTVPESAVARLFDATKYDFSAVPRDIALIASVPGFHRGTMLDKFGHMALRRHLREVSLFFSEADSQVAFQCSSLGLLDASFQNEFLQSLYLPHSIGDRRFHVLYPSFGNAIMTRSQDCQGYMCLARKHWDSPQFPRHWFADIVPPDAASAGLLWHSKILVRKCNASNGFWLYAGSANFSPSAWGRLRGGISNQGLQIFNFELGVLFLPSEVRMRDGLENWASLPFQMPSLDRSPIDGYTPFIAGE